MVGQGALQELGLMRFRADIVCLMFEMRFLLDGTMRRLFYIIVTDKLNKLH